MKTFFSILFSIVFLANAMGLTIISDSCGMKLSTAGFAEQERCCKKKTEMPNNCCKNELKCIKITNDYEPFSALRIEKTATVPVIINYNFYSLNFYNPISCTLNFHSPPPKSERFIEFHSLLI